MLLIVTLKYYMFIQLLKEKIKTKMQTLFQIGLDFVAKNIHYVDSLEGFPELVGEMLSKRVVSLRTEDINNIVSCYKITEYRGIDLIIRVLIFSTVYHFKFQSKATL